MLLYISVFIMKSIKNADSKKTEIIPFRCTEKMKKDIENKSKKLYGSEKKNSKFIQDCIEDGIKRNTKRDKNHVREMVHIQEDLNNRILNTPDDKHKEELISIGKELMKLWHN